MNFWLLTTEYPPFYGGGISTYCYFTANMLAQKGHQVSVFVNDARVSDIAIETNQNIRVIRFNPSLTGSIAFIGYITNISYEFAHIVKHFIEKEGKPDIIEAQEYLGIAYYLLQFKHLLYSWCNDIPIVITVHSPAFLYLEYNHVPIYKYPNYWIGEMERYSLQAADLLIAPSRYIIEAVSKKFNLKNEALVFLPNPYQSESSKSVATEEGDQIVFYGKLSAQKGIFQLLRYFKQAWESGFDQPLYLIGGQDIVYHPEGITMGDWVRKHYKTFIGKDLLLLEDKISPDKIEQRLSKAKVVIVPSTVDNLPYVVFEVMALGKIVLVSKQGGHAEVVEDGVNGFVFDHNEPQTFLKGLFKILSLTEEERNNISTNAKIKIKEAYSFEKIYKQKVQLLDGLKEKNTSRQIFPFIRQKEVDEQNSNNQLYEKGLLSVVVPYYNMGKYVEETIASIQKSHYLQKEIIIVNDGSTDEGSLKKLNGFRNTPRIKVLDTPNGGLVKARNYGAENARGEFLAFLDADDIVEKRYYAKTIEVLNQYRNVHFVGCWTKYFEGSQNVWPTFTPEPPLLLYHNIINSSALVYKRYAFLKCGINDAQMTEGLEDYESVINLVDNGYGGVVLPEVLFHYRVRKDSMIRGISSTKKLLLHQYIADKHKALYATFAADISNLLNANGPGIYLDNPSLDYNFNVKFPFINKFSKKLIHFIKSNRYAKAVAYRVYRLINR